jgi:hypothetical protein
MAVTPLLKPLQDKRGTLYNFQSALEDINITLANGQNKVRFSKFALLRIPEIGTPDNLQTDNKIQFSSPGETPLIEGLQVDNNINLAESFQNYALNMESLLLSKSTYVREEKLTVSERVFWKWLKELGAIDFQDASAVEKNVANLPVDLANHTEYRFVEKTETNSTYNRVVKYIGEIDVVNSLASPDNSYTEVYIHVPTTVGTTPHVLFKSVKDTNYYPGMTIVNTPSDPLDIEYLSGRHSTDTHPFGLSLKAFYDLDDGSVATQIKNTYSGSYATGNWFTQTTKNTYFTDNYNSTGAYNVSRTQWIKKTLNATQIQYKRNQLDGISLDFDLANYKLAASDPNIKTFSQFNDYVANRDFEFNAILIYYDTYDPNNLDSSGNPIDYKTNLYGVLFLDKIEQSGLEFQIPFIAKYKPDALNKTNGNSFSFKLNLKLDSSAEDTFVEKSINDYSTFSLELFTDVLTKFSQLQTSYSNKLLELDQLQQEVNAVKDLLINSVDWTELGTRVTNLENSQIANQALSASAGSIIKMIDNVNEKLNSILTGSTNLTVSYDLDAIRQGEGIGIDRTTPNRLKISNTNQQYNITTNSVTNFFSSPTLSLVSYNNYFVHQNSGVPIILTTDLSIYIDDTNVAWKTGQVVRLVFEDEVVPDIFNVKIYTDALNKKNLGAFGVAISVLDDLDFTPSSNKPIFEVICLDDQQMTFRLDKIR